jgi:uncharacterized membrane protein YuzA (DUF378 family)
MRCTRCVIMAAFVKALIVIACVGALNLAPLGIFRVDVLGMLGVPEAGERVLYALVGVSAILALMLLPSLPRQVVEFGHRQLIPRRR